MFQKRKRITLLVLHSIFNLHFAHEQFDECNCWLMDSPCDGILKLLNAKNVKFSSVLDSFPLWVIGHFVKLLLKVVMVGEEMRSPYIKLLLSRIFCNLFFEWSRMCARGLIYMLRNLPQTWLNYYFEDLRRFQKSISLLVLFARSITKKIMWLLFSNVNTNLSANVKIQSLKYHDRLQRRFRPRIYKLSKAITMNKAWIWDL